MSGVPFKEVISPSQELSWVYGVSNPLRRLRNTLNFPEHHTTKGDLTLLVYQNLWFSLSEWTKNPRLEINLKIISTPQPTDVKTEVQAEVILELN